MSKLQDGLWFLVEEEEECPFCEGKGGTCVVPPAKPLPPPRWPTPKERNEYMEDLRKGIGIRLSDCEECKNIRRVTRPRLVRVGEETCRLDLAYYCGENSDFNPKESPRRVLGEWFEIHPGWHGILWRRSLECPGCHGNKDFFILPKATCGVCHGKGTLTEYAKVERELCH